MVEHHVRVYFKDEPILCRDCGLNLDAKLREGTCTAIEYARCESCQHKVSVGLAKLAELTGLKLNLPVGWVRPA